jgi:regulator of RNase E activity RraA
MIIINDRVEKVSQAVIDGFKAIGVGDIGHIAQWGFMATAIRPVWRDIRLVGPAFTLRMPSMDIGIAREAISRAAPGDVIVVDRGGDTEIACWGGNAALHSKVRGIAGLIIDGAVTDTMEITELRWPVYSRSVSGLVGRRLNTEGEINTTINCGGVPVSPGDLICADDDGIVVIRPEEAEALLKACQDRFGHVQPIRKWIADGKPLEDYPGVKS